MKDKKRILVVGAYAPSLLNFRGDLINKLQQKGFEVIAMAADDSEVGSQLEKTGVRFVPYKVGRNGVNPFVDLVTLVSLIKAIRALKPTHIFAYTIKPVVWGGIAQYFCKKVHFYPLITGLGFAFHEGGKLKNILRILVIWLYRISLSNASRVIFQNKDNKSVFIDNRIISEEKSRLVNGSGVNLSKFTRSEFPDGKFTFLMIARLLRDKGLFEYSKAAEKIKKSYPEVEFLLIGPDDPSPDGVPISTVKNWEKNGSIKYLGEAKDVRPFIAKSHVYVLPSYHEGLPRTVLEAMAMGRPIITTNVPGCKETVLNSENGFLVNPANSEQIAEKMVWFIQNKDKVESMGEKSWELVKNKFDVVKINEEIISILQDNK